MEELEEFEKNMNGFAKSILVILLIIILGGVGFNLWMIAV